MICKYLPPLRRLAFPSLVASFIVRHSAVVLFVEPPCWFSLLLPPSDAPRTFSSCMPTDSPPIRDYMILSVTSSSFHLSWRVNGTQNRTFHVQVHQGGELLRSAWTQGTAIEVTGLEAGVLYVVRTSYQACGTNVTATLTVRTGKALVGTPNATCELVSLSRFHRLQTLKGLHLLYRAGAATGLLPTPVLMGPWALRVL